MSIFDEAKIDSHCHILDPARFAYAPDVAYRPGGQEIGTLAQYRAVMAAYGVRHALLVGPNSGYGPDNRCLLDAIAAGRGRAPGGLDTFKGIAVVRNSASRAELITLKDAGIVGIAFNPSLLGVAHYVGDPATPALLRQLAELGMFIQVQVEHDQMLAMAPMLLQGGAHMLIDHCGRPDPKHSIKQPGFQALLKLAGSGRAAVKLSGWQKFSKLGPPHTDAQPFVRALIDAFMPEACVWASDWPYLKATERLDYGVQLALIERVLPDANDRRRVLWETPRRLFRFAPPA